MPGRPFSLALLGADGAAGRAVLEALEDLDVPLAELRLLSAEDAGPTVEVRGEERRLRQVAPGAFRGCDVAILCGGPAAVGAWAPVARAEGALVVAAAADLGEAPGVPLVVPEINPEALDGSTAGTVASPGSIAIGLALALRPLHAAAGLERVVAVTFQAVSGAGRAGEEQLQREAADLMNGRDPRPPAPLPHRIAFNVVPQAGAAGPDGRAGDEARAGGELRTLLGLPALPVSVTAVRVPVFHGDAAAVHLGLARPLAPEAAREALRGAQAVKVLDLPEQGIYPMPMLAVNDDAVLVGRLRADAALPNGLALFLAIDDQRKGGATNLVQLAEAMAARRPSA
jgi:aspartate-semialdehyde dehydrogenase